jgi:predicted transcriptional regulator
MAYKTKNRNNRQIKIDILEACSAQSLLVTEVGNSTNLSHDEALKNLRDLEDSGLVEQSDSLRSKNRRFFRVNRTHVKVWSTTQKGMEVIRIENGLKEMFAPKPRLAAETEHEAKRLLREEAITE